MLASEQAWVGEIVRRRNAVEHPAGRSGTLYFENPTLHPNGQMVMRVWWLNVGVGQNLLQALDVTFGNLCTLAEDILLQCMRHSGLPEYVAFYEIPVEKRDLTCPSASGRPQQAEDADEAACSLTAGG